MFVPVSEIENKYFTFVLIFFSSYINYHRPMW